jgi:hypothetical protein
MRRILAVSVRFGLAGALRESIALNAGSVAAVGPGGMEPCDMRLPLDDGCTAKGPVRMN